MWNREIHGIAHFAVPMAIFISLAGFAMAARSSKAEWKESSIDFGASPFVKLVIATLSGGFLVGFIGFIAEYQFQYGSVIFLALGLLGFFALPPKIIVNSDYITSKYWWKGEEKISWIDVRSINYQTNAGGIEILAKDGRRIEFTKLNRDPAQFVVLCGKFAPRANR